MAKPIVMPQVGQDLTEGKLIEWCVKVGDPVKKGDILAVVESEKASFEVEAYEEGLVLELFYEAGDMATVLEPLLTLGDAGETATTSKPAGKHRTKGRGYQARHRDRARSEQGRDTPNGWGNETRGFSTPSHTDGRGRYRTTLQQDAASHCEQVAGIQTDDSTFLSDGDLIVHATALTLLEYPDLNCFVSNTGILKKAEVNIGVAVSVENGLMVPAIENTPHKSLREISKLIRDYAAAARRGMNKSQAKSTFSISNLGMYGVEVLPIINLPEAGILGVGPIKRVVKEHRGGLHGRDVLSLSLAADHRAVDGVYGARFLKSLVENIENYAEFD